MQINNHSSARFSAAPSPRSLGNLGRNIGLVLQDFMYGKVHDVQVVKSNAFILSSLIQVISRIFVANNTARKTAGKPEGPFRSMEAVKTTFREITGFTLSYGVMRFIQRATTDFFRNYFWVKSGVTSKPTFLNPLFRRLFVPRDIHLPNPSPPPRLFPSLWATCKRIGKEFADYGRKTQGKYQLTAIDKLFPEVIPDRGVIMDPRRLLKYQKLEKWIDRVSRIGGKASGQLLRPQKLKLWFELVPPLIGSIPALLLSGWLLERFSQNHAESLAQKILGAFRKLKGNPPNMGLSRPAGNSGFNPPALDPSAILPYARGKGIPFMQPGLPFDGYPFPPGIRHPFFQ